MRTCPPGRCLLRSKCSRARSSTSRAAMSKRVSAGEQATAGFALASSSCTRTEISLQRSYLESVAEDAAECMEVDEGDASGKSDQEGGGPLAEDDDPFSKAPEEGGALATAEGPGALSEVVHEEDELPSYSCCSCGLPRQASTAAAGGASAAAACTRCLYRVFRKDPVKVGVEYSTD